MAAARDGTRGKEVVEQTLALGGRAGFVQADLAGTYADLRAFADTVTSLRWTRRHPGQQRRGLPGHGDRGPRGR